MNVSVDTVRRGHRPQVARRRFTESGLFARAGSNQAEVFASILGRHHRRYFTDPGDLADKISCFQQHYDAGAEPFDWRFTKTELRHSWSLASHSDPAHLPA